MKSGYYWFSNYAGSGWRPEYDYNTLFADQVLAVRKAFDLEKSRDERAVAKGKGTWIDFKFDDGTAKVRVNKFKYGGFTMDGALPLIKFELDFDYQVFPVNHRSGYKGHDNMLIVFPPKFPQVPPSVKFTSEKYTFQGSSHDHHILGGWLCLHKFNTDWDTKLGTVMVAVNWAIEWLVLHHRNFGEQGWWG